MINDFKFLDPGLLIDENLEVTLVKKVPADPDKGYFPKYEFELKDRATGEIMGQISLRVGNNDNTKYGGHIGYEVEEKFRGRRLASRALRLLFPLALKHGLNPLWITCNPENIASRKTCELAGGELVEIVDLPEDNDQYKRGERKKCRYKFDLSDNNLL